MNSDLAKHVQRLVDIEDIKQLKARYAAACDDNYNPDALASLFTEDAIWEGGILGHAKGREGIRRMFANIPKTVPFAVHQISNPLIEVDGDSATGSWYLWQPMLFGDQALWLSAKYSDRYVRQGGVWLYQHLKLDVRMLTPYEVGFGKMRIIDVPR